MRSPVERHEYDLYQAVWSAVRHYRDFSPGEQLVGLFTEIVGGPPGTVLDAGCGAGKGAVALAERGFDVACCDLTAEGVDETFVQYFPFVETPLWTDLAPVAYLAKTVTPAFDGVQFDHVYCCDVLEHVPMQLTMLCVYQMLRVARHGVFLSVCLGSDNGGMFVGEPLHKTVQPYLWWKDSLATLGHLRDARDLLQAGVFYLEPHRAQ